MKHKKWLVQINGNKKIVTFSQPANYDEAFNLISIMARHHLGENYTIENLEPGFTGIGLWHIINTINL